MEIDIKPKNTDRLRENEISSLFTSQNSYSKIMGRETIFIIGPKGTGKSNSTVHVRFQYSQNVKNRTSWNHMIKTIVAST